MTSHQLRMAVIQQRYDQDRRAQPQHLAFDKVPPLECLSFTVPEHCPTQHAAVAKCTKPFVPLLAPPRAQPLCCVRQMSRDENAEKLRCSSVPSDSD